MDREVSPRRLRWIFRIVLYGTLALIGVALMAARPGDRIVLSGNTSQDEFFNMEADSEGGVSSFQTHLRARCGRDQWWQVSWTPADGHPVDFERDGPRLDVREEWENELGDGSIEKGWAELEADVEDEGRSVTGVMHTEITFTLNGERYATCSAWGVRVSADAD
jgi:hypothetical protein